MISAVELSFSIRVGHRRNYFEEGVSGFPETLFFVKLRQRLSRQTVVKRLLSSRKGRENLQLFRLRRICRTVRPAENLRQNRLR